MHEPACWEMRWPEVAVLDGNAAALGIEEASLMDSAGKALAATALEMTDTPGLVPCGPGTNRSHRSVPARYLRALRPRALLHTAPASPGPHARHSPAPPSASPRPSGPWTSAPLDLCLSSPAVPAATSIRLLLTPGRRFSQPLRRWRVPLKEAPV